jgi:hypothetical protein
MHIILDTSVIVKEGYFRSGMMRALLKAAHFMDLKVLMPDVVWDELLGKAEKEIAKRTGAYDKAARGLNAITGKKIEPVNAASEFGDYENWLAEEIEKFGIDFLPYPATTTKELVTKSYEGEKPFKEDGDGHKDYLIWKSIIEFLQNQQAVAPTYFLTNNKKDFCADAAPPLVLHADLASQLPEGQSVNVYLDVGSFFGEIIAPHLKGLDINEIPDDLVNRAIELIESNLTDYSAFGFEGVPLQNDVSIASVENVEIVDRAIQSLDDDEFLVTFDCKFDADISGFMDKSEYYSGDQEVFVWEANWNDYVMLVSTSARLPVRVSFTYSKSEGGITSSDVDLPTEYSDIDY